MGAQSVVSSSIQKFVTSCKRYEFVSQKSFKFNNLHYKTNHPMPKYVPFQILSLIYLLRSVLSQPLYRPQNILAQNKILYASSTAYITPTNFNITFSEPLLNVPVVSYGLNNYHMGDRFYYQNFGTLISQTTATYFVVQVRPIQSTYVYKLSICYLAIDDQMNFATFAKSYPNPPTVSAETGHRSTTIYQPFYFQELTAVALFITGFYLQSINQFYLYTTVGQIYSYGFEFTINTLSDCTVHRLDLSFLFYQNNQTQKYFIRTDTSYCYYNITDKAIITTFTSVDAGVFLFGMAGFGGQTYDSIIDFGWSILGNIDSTFIVTINTANLTFLCYNYIQIFSLEAPPPQEQPPSNNLIQLIIAAICSLCSIFLIIMSIRCFCNSKYMQRKRMEDSKKKLSVTTLNQLPSLHF